MPSPTPLARQSMRRCVCPCSGISSPFAVARRWSGAAGAALVSPRQPLEHLFRVSRKTAAAAAAAAPSSAVIVHTGYHTPLSGSAGCDPGAAASPVSYEVSDVGAFEKLIEDALRITPITATHQSAKPSEPSAATPAPSTSVTKTILANHTVRELQTLLAEAERALKKPAARKAEVDRYVKRVYLPLLKYGTFALLALQFGVYFNWIFFVFDWNLVEPTTYFLGYTSVFCSLVYHYYRCGEDSFSWRNLFQHMAHHEAEKMYVKKNVEEKQVALLERRVAEIKAELARVTI